MDDLRGVKGWLLTFVIIMAVISPVASVIMVYVELYTGQAAYLPDIPQVAQLRMFTWALVAVDAVIGWFAVYRLLAIRNWLSVQITIACVWIGSVGIMIVGLFGVTAITGASVGDLMAEGAGPRTIIQPFGFALIWTAYLLKSERVKNTYRGVEEEVEVFE
jgi:hypothetical protein